LVLGFIVAVLIAVAATVLYFKRRRLRRRRCQPEEEANAKQDEEASSTQEEEAIPKQEPFEKPELDGKDPAVQRHRPPPSEVELAGSPVHVRELSSDAAVDSNVERGFPKEMLGTSVEAAELESPGSTITYHELQSPGSQVTPHELSSEELCFAR
jgi:hypothetical protein